MTDFEKHERQEEILALIKMMGYAAGVASELEALKASSLIQEAQSALLSILEEKFPLLSKQQLLGWTGDTHGHC